MRVCYFGTYRSEYARNQIMIEGLRRNGVDVVEIHETLWHGIEDRVHMASGGWRNPGFWLRLLKTYFRLIWRHRSCDYDVMIVGYPGQFDIYLAWFLTRIRRKPLVWDIFMSIYLIALERKLDLRSPFTVAALRKIEGFACNLPDLLILDTEEYVDWFAKTHQISLSRYRTVPTGADDRIFKPVHQIHGSDFRLQVVYYGSFIPNHGVMYIIEAARILAPNDQIHFLLIGDGPERQVAEKTAREYGLANLTFTGWLDKEVLVERASAADFCLGVFGVTPQSLMTIQNKIYECLAMAKPLISGVSSPVQKSFEHRKHLFLIKRADGKALADAILELGTDPELRNRLSTNGYRQFIENFTPTQLGARFLQHLHELV